MVSSLTAHVSKSEPTIPQIWGVEDYTSTRLIHATFTPSLREEFMGDGWSEWLAVLGAPNPQTECHALALLGMLRKRPSLEVLQQVLIGDNFAEVERISCDKDTAAALIDDFRQHHSAVRVEGGTNETVDVVAYDRVPNLYELRDDLDRRWLVAQIELACRRLVPDDPAAGLRLGRQIFQACLTHGARAENAPREPAGARRGIREETCGTVALRRRTRVMN